MRCTHLHRFAAVAVISTLRTFTLTADQPTVAHVSVRSGDARLQALVERGIAGSPTFRRLVDRLNRSDVVVYLQCDRRVRHGLEARLSFMSAVGGYRYLLVRLAMQSSNTRQIAVIGHELQHAVEIAERAAIVDPPSLLREYRRFSTVRPRMTGALVELDTRDANEQQMRVWRELRQDEDERPRSTQ